GEEVADLKVQRVLERVARGRARAAGIDRDGGALLDGQRFGGQGVDGGRVGGGALHRLRRGVGGGGLRGGFGAGAIRGSRRGAGGQGQHGVSRTVFLRDVELERQPGVARAGSADHLVEEVLERSPRGRGAGHGNRRDRHCAVAGDRGDGD